MKKCKYPWNGKFMITLKKIAGYEEIFTIACWKKGTRCFEILEPTKDYWYADPIYFSYKNEEYIFCEMYDRKRRKGVIGVSRYMDEALSLPEKIIEEPFHMSYPFLFEYGNKIFMLPETSGARALCFYESVEFPYKWKLVSRIATKDQYVDSNIFIENGDIIMLSTILNDENLLQSRLVLDTLKYDGSEFRLDRGKHQEIGEFTYECRNAGAWIRRSDTLYRAVQYSTDQIYGYMIAINRIELLTHSEFRETTVQKIFPEDILCSCKGRVFTPMGTHTYAGGSGIIDVKMLIFNKSKWLNRLLLKLKG